MLPKSAKRLKDAGQRGNKLGSDSRAKRGVAVASMLAAAQMVHCGEMVDLGVCPHQGSKAQVGFNCFNMSLRR